MLCTDIKSKMADNYFVIVSILQMSVFVNANIEHVIRK